MEKRAEGETTHVPEARQSASRALKGESMSDATKPSEDTQNAEREPNAPLSQRLIDTM